VNTPAHPNTFGARDTLRVGNRSYTYFRLDALAAKGYDLATLPFSFKVLLENLLRFEDGRSVTPADCKTSPAFRVSSTSRRCAMRSPTWAANRPRSTRCSRLRS
jgi:aconitate hydratase